MPKFEVTTVRTDPLARTAAQELAALRPGTVLRVLSPTVIMVLNHANVSPKVWKPSVKAVTRNA
jgi:hypothetical protein